MLAAVLCPLPACPGSASAGGPGSTSVQILKADLSPRAMAMGGVFAAIADDIYAAQYNPAGLGQLVVPAASAMYYSGFEDSRLQYLTLGMPAPIHGLAGLERPVVAFSAVFTQNGDFTQRTVNPDDTISVGNTVSAENNRVLAFSYGEKVYSGDLKIGQRSAVLEHYLGGSAKYIHSALLEQYSASAFALDVGWLGKMPDLGLAAGMSLANYGSGLKYLKDSNPLPSVARIGLAWQRPTVRNHSVLLSVEGDAYTGEKLWSYRTGLEYNFEQMFSFRLGYKGHDDNKGVAMGLGAHHEGFAVDFGISLGNAVFNTTQVAFTYQFTGFDLGRPKKARYIEQEEDQPKPQKTVKPARTKPAPAKRKPVPDKKGSDFYWVD